MTPGLLLTNNATLSFEDGGSGGTATGAGALRYRDGKFAGSQAALVEAGATNLLANPSFESSISHWVRPAFQGTLTQMTSGGYSGVAYARAVGGGCVWNRPDMIPVDVGDPVFVGAAIRSPVGDTATVGIEWINTDGGWAGETALGTVTGTGDWQEVAYTIVKPSAGDGVAPTFKNASGTVDVDAVQITTGWQTTYTDGSLGTGYAWTGTANDSASIRAAASITIPYSGTVGSLACWYSEDFGATWSWHYAEALGSIGTYGDIADDGSGNLVITSDRALLLGPLAVWSDTLTVEQQAGVQAYSDVWTWADISSVPVTLDTAMTAAGTSAATLGSAVTLATAGTAAGTSTATMSVELARMLDTSMLAAGSSTATLDSALDLLTAMLAAGTSTAVMHPEAGPLPQLGSVTYTERPRPLALGYTPIPSPIAVGYTPRPPSED